MELDTEKENTLMELVKIQIDTKVKFTKIRIMGK